MNFLFLWNIIWEIQDISVNTVEIKGNQNGLVKFYKMLFCVPTEESRLERHEGEPFFMWQKMHY